MRNCFRGSIRMLVAVLALPPVILGQSAAQSQAVPRTPDGKPDLSGVWTHAGTAVDGSPVMGFLWSDEEPPMQPWAAERYKVVREGARNRAHLRG